MTEAKTIKIEKMQESDFEEMRNIFIAAWTNYFSSIEQNKPVKPRTDLNYKSYLDANPEGCFVAKENGKVIGSIFSHVWGKVGWFGPLEVSPERQNKSVGRMLIDASLKYLEKSGCETIGLETMPASNKNIALYAKYGFAPVCTTIRVSKDLAKPENGNSADAVESRFRIMEFSEVNRAVALKAIRRISNSVHRGLDYTKEIGIALSLNLGKTFLLLEEKHIIGFALLYIYRAVEGSEAAGIRILAIEPKYASNDAMFALISVCEKQAINAGKKELGFFFYTGSAVSINSLLESGYSVANCFVRMLKKGNTGKPDALHFSRWSG
jgi:ribosomal protein S18 acetylase RimI-like enzyme